MLRGAVVVSVVLCSCGRSELIDGRETELPSSIGRPEMRTCSAIDPGPPRLDTVSTWPDGCLDVEYTPEIAHELPLLEAALARWAAPDCTRICFNRSREWIPQAGQSQFILFDFDDGALRPSDGVLGVFFTNVRSGIRKHVMMVRRRNTSATQEDFTRAVGEALGLAPRANVSSSLSESRVELTEADRQSVCSVYPCR